MILWLLHNTQKLPVLMHQYSRLLNSGSRLEVALLMGLLHCIVLEH